MFFEALQSYCAPVLTIAVFGAIVIKDTLFDKRVRYLFLCESFVILLIIAATWADRCLSAVELGGMAWRLRTATTYINFSFSPVSPLLLMMIYNKKPIAKQLIFFIPMVVNLALCTISLYSGWVFHISSQNIYNRGPLFFVPFLVSGLYLLGMIVFSAKKEQQQVNRREETQLLIIIMIAIATATLLEIIFVKRFMLWSTTEVCVVLYFTLLSRQKVKYDDLTGTYSRIAYSRQIEQLSQKKNYVIAMIDIDGLKNINDTLGHSCGDKAIYCIANGILTETGKNMQLFRIGGDEFVLIAVKSSENAVQSILEKAKAGCGDIENIPVSFSYGTATLSENGSYDAARNLADKRLYENKAKLKKEKLISSAL